MLTALLWETHTTVRLMQGPGQAISATSRVEWQLSDQHRPFLGITPEVQPYLPCLVCLPLSQRPIKPLQPPPFKPQLASTCTSYRSVTIMYMCTVLHVNNTTPRQLSALHCAAPSTPNPPERDNGAEPRCRITTPGYHSHRSLAPDCTPSEHPRYPRFSYGDEAASVEL
jgi:hypothetical protein